MEIANLIAALRAPDCDNCPCTECKPDRNLTRCMLFDKAADALEALTEVKSMPKNVKCKNCANLKRSGWCERVVDSPCPDLRRIGAAPAGWLQGIHLFRATAESIRFCQLLRVPLEMAPPTRKGGIT